MKAGQLLVARLKSKAYWHGVVKSLAYPLLDDLVASTDNKLDDAGLAMGKNFLDMVLSSDEEADAS